MTKSDEILRLEADLSANEELREALNAAVERIAETGEAASDGEVLAKAAAELGYDVSLVEIERLYADSQELSDEELEAMAGGWYENWCLVDWYCFTAFRQNQEDYPYSGPKDNMACWSNYNCVFVNN